jgi:pimeloyl-ACP methyl ester carboxylesterase
MRTRLKSPTGATVSYSKYGSGPPLVLVHGGFSDYETNWEFVKPILEKRFTIYASARRGRGDTDATEGHGVEDEASDVVVLIRTVGERVFLLGHSYGAICSLNAAMLVPDRIRKLILYEPGSPRLLPAATIQHLSAFAAAGEWGELAISFFRDTLHVPIRELEALRASVLWPPIAADARASLGDLHALSRYDFRADRYKGLTSPVLLQIGSESPRELYLTDALAAVLPDVRIEELPGQAHEGMTTAPDMYADAVIRFLLGQPEP